MKIVYLRLKNYVGFLTGIGCTELELDMSKFCGTIALISGPNGTGKTTLLNAMHPMPDSTSSYIPGVEAEKELYIDDADRGKFYEILIKSPITANGTRLSHKAFIKVNGIEMNDTGNVNMYKDIIESEMDMDPMFMTLTAMSATNRGLADMTPADRKKYVASILSEVEVYNQMYKKLTKKSTYYKGTINNLGNKIAKLGNAGAIQARLTEAQSILNMYKNNLDINRSSISRMEGKMDALDPDGSLQMKIVEAADKYDSALIKYKTANTDYHRIYNNSSIGGSCNTWADMAKDSQSKIDYYNAELEKHETSQAILSEKASFYSREITQQKAKISSLQNEMISNDPSNAISELQNKIEATTAEIIDVFGTDDVNEYEAQLLAERLKGLHEAFDAIWADPNYSNNAITILNTFFDEEVNYTKHVQSLHNQLEKIQFEIKDLYNKIADLKSMSDILDKRPKECTINTCPFIKDAMNTEYSLNILEKIERYKTEIQDKDKDQDNIEKLLGTAEKNYSVYQNIINMYSWIEASPIFAKFKKTSVYLIRGYMMDQIRSGSSYTVMKVSDANRGVSLLRDRKETLELLENLKKDKTIYDINKSNLDQLRVELEKRDDEYKSILEEINSLTIQIAESKSKIDDETEQLRKIENIIQAWDLRETTYKAMMDAKDVLDKYEAHSKDILDMIKTRDAMKQTVIQDEIQYNSQLEIVNGLKSQVKQIAEYVEELAKYRDKYTLVEKVKRYTSPNTGIQTAYVSMYMNKTLVEANELLGSLFNGSIKLEPYIITENEFRMPVTNSGMLIDDLSNCSASQVAMAAMILSFVLVHQASSTYDIFRLDETDAPLDTNHRIYYPQLLLAIAVRLNIKQIFAISHSIESSLFGVDRIILENGKIVMQSANNQTWEARTK